MNRLTCIVCGSPLPTPGVPDQLEYICSSCGAKHRLISGDLHLVSTGGQRK